MFSVRLVFTSNLNSQTTWLKVKFKLVNLYPPDEGSLAGCEPLVRFEPQTRWVARVDSCRGGIVSPGHCFNSWGVGTKSEAYHTTNNVTRKVKKHVAGKDVWRTFDWGPLYRDGTFDDKWSVCCCALNGAQQNKVPNNPSASP